MLAKLSREEVNRRWQERMAPFFEIPPGARPDQALLELEEVSTWRRANAGGYNTYCRLGYSMEVTSEATEQSRAGHRWRFRDRSCDQRVVRRTRCDRRHR